MGGPEGMVPARPRIKMEAYKDRHILVFGLARSGFAAARLLLGAGARVCGADENENIEIPPDLTALETHFGHFREEIIDDIDEIIISPGIPDDHPVFAAASERDIAVIGELELAFRFARAPVIAVTGTNGKSTTVEMIGAMLKEDGREAVVAGNTGTPFSSVIGEIDENGFFVIEVSSFQLETIDRFHPLCAGILNLTPDHLDRYRSLEDYYGAKEKLLYSLAPDDHFFFSADDPLCVAAAGRTEAVTVPFSSSGRVKGGVYLDGDLLIRESADGTEEIVCDRDGIRVVGIHNVENALAAVAAVTPFGVTADSCRRALATFAGLPHRMELVARSGGLAFFNDSKATNVEAAVKSLKGLDSPVVLIAGGHDKGGDFSKLFELSDIVRSIVTIGEAAELIEKASGGRIPCSRASSMKEAVAMAAGRAEEGWLVVLSPACASFDMFDNFEHRGRVFRDSVLELVKGGDRENG
jgi:UDP-N-acetylmuramoylalanine--D-glutamate ligase